MRSVMILCVLVSTSAAVPVFDEAQAKVVSYDNTNDGTGNYKFSFQTSNGIYREETGQVVNAGQDNEHIVVEGSYSYTDVDGNVVVVNYKADENGYQETKPVLQPQVTYALPGALVATLLGK